jgi:hypothetical protein
VETRRSLGAELGDARDDGETPGTASNGDDLLISGCGDEEAGEADDEDEDEGTGDGNAGLCLVF